MMNLIKRTYGEKAVEQPAPKKPNAPVPSPEDIRLEKVRKNLFKLDKALEGLKLQVSEEEKKSLQDFLSSDETVSQSFGFLKMLPSGHSHLRTGLHSQETVLKGNDGIFAIIRPDAHERKVCNLCYPAFDTRLRTIEVLPKVQVAFKTWVASMKNLQVQENHQLTGEELPCDREYLNKVVERMMDSSLTTLVSEVLGESPVYREIYIAPIIYGYDDDGKQVSHQLFTTDPIEHAKKMGDNVRVDTRLDLLQGEVDVFDVSLPENDEVREYRIAGIDPEKPSLYLHRGKKGYRPNLYIPEGMMQEFLQE